MLLVEKNKSKCTLLFLQSLLNEMPKEIGDDYIESHSSTTKRLCISTFRRLLNIISGRFNRAGDQFIVLEPGLDFTTYNLIEVFTFLTSLLSTFWLKEQSSQNNELAKIQKWHRKERRVFSEGLKNVFRYAFSNHRSYETIKDLSNFIKTTHDLFERFSHSSSLEVIVLGNLTQSGTNQRCFSSSPPKNSTQAKVWATQDVIEIKLKWPEIVDSDFWRDTTFHLNICRSLKKEQSRFYNIGKHY